MSKEQELRQVIGQWRDRLQRALLAVANQQRTAQGKPPLPAETLVLLPIGRNKAESLRNGLYLLNLRVWTIRYGVSPEFVLRAVCKQYGWPDAETHSNKQHLRLGITAAQLGGVATRTVVEQAVAKAYPNGENWRMKESEALVRISSIPRTRFSLEDPDESLQRYRDKINRIRKEQAAQQASRTRTLFHRNFRKPPQQTRKG